MECHHNELRFDGKQMARIICIGCGKKWERCVEYVGSMRVTRLRSNNRLTPEILKNQYGIKPQEANMI